MTDGSLTVLAIVVALVGVPLLFLGARWLDKKEKEK